MQQMSKQSCLARVVLSVTMGQSDSSHADLNNGGPSQHEEPRYEPHPMSPYCHDLTSAVQDTHQSKQDRDVMDHAAEMFGYLGAGIDEGQPSLGKSLDEGVEAVVQIATK